MIRRRPPIKSVGNDPDYRFTLANERTFLAWLRTGLALLAGAVALASLVHNFGPKPMRITITVLLLALWWGALRWMLRGCRRGSPGGN